jgi:hypothetical protein
MSDEATLASGYGGAYEAGWQSGREDGRKEERARIRALVQKEIEYWQSDFVLRQFFGHIAGLRRALTMIDAEDTTNE